MDSRSGVMKRRGGGYVLLSAAVSMVVILALPRANYLVAETVGNACGSYRDAIRWSLMVKACHLSDVDRIDLVNGGFVVLVVLAALNPTLVALRGALLVLVLMYLNDAGRAHDIGHVYPGIELWYLPILWLSALILVTSLVIVLYRWAKRWLGTSGRAAGIPDDRRGVVHDARGITAAPQTSPTAPDSPPPAGRPRP